MKASFYQKNSAVEIDMDIHSIFQQSYTRTNYIDFFKNSLLADDFILEEEEISFDEFGFTPNKLASLHYLGRSESLGVSVYEVSHQSNHDARVTLSREIFQVLAYLGERRALVLFVPQEKRNYRLSLVTMDLEAAGKRIKKVFSNPRRYSFYLGEHAKVHTPAKQLRKRLFDFNDLQQAFSLEVVNEDFFREIATLFTKLTGGKRSEKEEDLPALFHLPSQGESAEDKKRLKEFGVRLIGRIIFCWFLKKKESTNGIPLISHDILSKRAVLENPNYYHSILEKLFFQTLNTPITERHEEIKSSKIWNSIPFLNGGLFEPHHHDFFRQDHAFDNVLKIPDAWFEELFELLELYNFTIDESTPIDIDLSVDPEMMGRIFENLLAEINPETGETARKATGSFYTPRPIVEFMGNESIFYYLQEKTNIDECKLRSLLNYAEEAPELDNTEIEAIVDALYHLKILDPACGSSAFPMGIMQSMNLVLEKIDPEAILWVIRKIDDIADPEQRKMMDEKVSNEDFRYLRKLGIIQRCLYGVDIQQMAIDISKLRFFLTLIVDESVKDEEPNRGIHPLPNLSFKFVCANTLIALPEIEDQSQIDVFGSNVSQTLFELEKVRGSFFTSYGKEKEEKKRVFKALQAQIQDQLIRLNFATNKNAATLLSSWDPFSDNATSWFDPKWMFGIEKGFDIVIGNPPYIQLQKDFDGKQKFADLYKNEGYQTFARTGDIYCLFYERGIQSLKSQGILCYITSNKWMRADYGKYLRKYLGTKDPKVLIDLGPGVFNAATVDTNILLISNQHINEKDVKAIALTKKHQKHNLFDLKYLHLHDLGEDSWIILSPEEQKIKEKIERIGTPLKDWDINIYRGVLTGYNEAFIIDGATKDRLIAEDPKSAEIIKPILRGRDIKRYKAEFADKWLINTHNGYKSNDGKKIPPIDIMKYPAVKRHLDKYWEKIKKRDDQGKTPYNLRNCAYVEEFEKEKIVWKEMVQESAFAHDEEAYYCNDTCRIITGDNIRYLLSIFNSRLFFFFISKYYGGGGLGEKGIRMKHTFIEKCPVPVPNKHIQDNLISLVNKIILNIKKARTIKIEEQEVDIMIYKLYQLTYDEVCIVDPEFVNVLGREEYEGYEISE